jgi:hypothetical protein
MSPVAFLFRHSRLQSSFSVIHVSSRPFPSFTSPAFLFRHSRLQQSCSFTSPVAFLFRHSRLQQSFSVIHVSSLPFPSIHVSSNVNSGLTHPQYAPYGHSLMYSSTWMCASRLRRNCSMRFYSPPPRGRSRWHILAAPLLPPCTSGRHVLVQMFTSKSWAKIHSKQFRIR